MGTRDFLLPDLGEGLTEGRVVGWLVAVGDDVTVDQAVVEIETEKAVSELPSPFAGTVTALHADVGEEVEVGRPLLTVQESGAAGDADSAAGDADRAEGASVEDGSGSVLVGYGAGGDGAAARRRRHRTTGERSAAGDRPRAKPPVRKLAKDLGVDLASIRGSGPSGTITRDDVRAAADGDGHAPDEQVGVERVPVQGVRRRIAEHMVTSRREIPEATTWVDCDASRLLELREELDAQAEVTVTPLALVMRICVAGLARYPQLNARLDPDSGDILLQRFVHLGVAVDTARGLLVPVVKDAHQRTTLEMAAELRRLVRGARDGTLSAGELGGSTFTVSNYGAFGVDGGNPVINHPNAAILGTGRIGPKPWVVDGDLAVRDVMQLSVAFDHRVCDGATAAGFLRFVADCVERPERLLAVV